MAYPDLHTLVDFNIGTLTAEETEVAMSLDLRPGGHFDYARPFCDLLFLRVANGVTLTWVQIF